MKTSLLLTLLTPVSLAIPLVIPPSALRLSSQIIHLPKKLLYKPFTPHLPVTAPHLPVTPPHLPPAPLHIPVTPPHIPAQPLRAPVAPAAVPAAIPAVIPAVVPAAPLRAPAPHLEKPVAPGNIPAAVPAPIPAVIPEAVPAAPLRAPAPHLEKPVVPENKPVVLENKPVAPENKPAAAPASIPAAIPAAAPAAIAVSPVHEPEPPLIAPANKEQLEAPPAHIPAEDGQTPATPTHLPAEEGTNVKAPAVTKAPQATDEPSQLNVKFPHSSKVSAPIPTASVVRNDFSNYGCKEILFFYARGSTEVGNMGVPEAVGWLTAAGLYTAFGQQRVGVEGVEYNARIISNLYFAGTDGKGINNMKAVITKAAMRCPKSILVAAGYSQGAAVVHGAVAGLSPPVRARLAGVITYGDTRKAQDHGQIPNYPPSKTLILCNDGDWVCNGLLVIVPAHLSYAKRVPEAVAFLAERIKLAQLAGKGKNKKIKG